MKHLSFVVICIAILTVVVYKLSFSIFYSFILHVPGAIFAVMHPVYSYQHVELGHVHPHRINNNQNNQEKVGKETLKRPNIILIIADDLAINDLSGNAGALTPNIDSIAQNGVLFTEAYAAQATCAPSRASLYTGKCVCVCVNVCKLVCLNFVISIPLCLTCAVVLFVGWCCLFIIAYLFFVCC